MQTTPVLQQRDVSIDMVKPLRDVCVLLLAVQCAAAIGLPPIAVKSTPDAGDEPLRVDAAKVFNVRVPATVLAGSPFDIFLTLAPLDCSVVGENKTRISSSRCKPWSSTVHFEVAVGSGGGTVFTGSLDNVSSTFGGLGNGLSYKITGIIAKELGKQAIKLVLDNNKASRGEIAPRISSDDADSVELSVFSIPQFLSVLPPIITLICAVVTKQVVPALFIGIWSGAFLNNAYNPIASFCSTFSVYFVDAMASNGHTPVVLFALVLGGVLELVDKSGGATGLAKLAQKFASTRFRALLIAWGLSVLIFFDDYSCILIVGATLKQSLRKVRISPAKLAFIIHIVGVNLPSMIPISSWVGVELGYIQDQYSAIGLKKYGAFSVFLRTLPYRFFPLLSILVPLVSILAKRDFSVLLEAENEFLSELGDADNESGDRSDGSNYTLLDPISSGEQSGSNAPTKDAPHETKSEWCGNAVIPFSAIIIVTFAGIIVSGSNALEKANSGEGTSAFSIIDIVANADSVNSLLWSAAAASLVCVILFSAQSLMNIDTMVEAWTTGFKDMMSPILVLLLAWGLGGVINDLHTSVYLSSVLQGNLPVEWLPPLATILAAVVSFAAGSAMGTMGILFPLVLPLAFTLSEGSEESVMQAAAAVLAGSTFGNTCSPLADNTVLSSLSTGCDLVLHAKTMIPFTLLSFFVSLLCGTIPVAMGWYSPGIAILICVGVVVLFLFIFGKDVDERHMRRQSQIQ